MLYPLVSTRVVIGQFSGPYSPVRTVNLKLVLLQTCFVIYRQVFLTFIEIKGAILKLCFIDFLKILSRPPRRP